MKEGFYADVVVFTPESVRDRSTWERFAQAPEGVDYLIVNGCVQVENSRMTPNACGRLLRRTSAVVSER